MSAQPYETPGVEPVLPTIRSVREDLPEDLQPLFSAAVEHAPVPADLAGWAVRSRAYKVPELAEAAARAERIHRGEEEPVLLGDDELAGLLPGLPTAR
ncbi:hypothetical protein ACFY4B_27040 [Kitasatospora sp. NPDC001261]|uniref:hypothetical protein n=1 Tax=Kitasatospora sp. NPDC001261 TaxID=3364012 RepID=UPI003683B8CB